MAKKHFRNIDAESPDVVPVVNITAPMIDRGFLFSGRAFFTVTNAAGKTLTYKVHRRVVGDGRHKGDPTYFLRVRRRNDNAIWETLGVLLKDGTIKSTASNTSGMASRDDEMSIAQWAITTVINNAGLPPGYSITHMGKCGVCGKDLTNPLDNDSGIHQTCVPQRWE